LENYLQQITDQSAEVTKLKYSLIQTLRAIECGRLSPNLMENVPITNNCKNLITNAIIKAINQSNFALAIEYQKIGQKNWPDDFGKLEESDFDMILLIYCQNKRTKFPSKYYIQLF
jgi:hypothetical protein